MLLMIGYLFFSGLRSIFSGVLSAAGDSKFLSYLGGSSIWIFLLLPIYYLVLKANGSVSFAQALLMMYGAICAGICFLRYLIGSWREKSLMIEEESQKETKGVAKA